MSDSIRTLLLCSRPPWPPLGGDRLRTFQMARALASLGPLDLVATRAADEDPAAIRAGLPFVDRLELPLLRRGSAAWRCLGALARNHSLQQALYNEPAAQQAVQGLLDRSPAPSVIVAHLVRTIPWVGKTSTPLLADIQDTLSAQYRQAAGIAPGWRGIVYRLEQQRVQRAEFQACQRADAVSFISTRDRRLLLDSSSVASIASAVVPAAVDTERFAAADTSPQRDQIGFLGNLRTASNRDMANHFARSVLPLIRRQHPTAEFHIMGIEAPRAIVRLDRLPGVRFVGKVNEVPPALARCWLTVCPLRFGSGIPNKVLESLAVGRPVVATPQVAEALGEASRDVLQIAELDRPFAQRVSELLAQPDLHSVSASRCRDYVLAHHTAEQAFAPLLALVRRLHDNGSTVAAD